MSEKSFAQRLVKDRTGREVPELLRELYVDRRYTQQEIGAALGISRGTVQEWLDEFGISRADRPPLELEGVA